jgi:hypothetical protein
MKRALLLVALATTLVTPAYAADVVYPKGSHVGLVPLEGLNPARGFTGFEDRDAGVKVIVADLPATAFTSVDTTIKSGTPSPDGSKPEGFETSAGRKSYLNHETATEAGAKFERYALLVAGAGLSGYVVIQVPQQATATYSEAAIRKMLATTTMRADVPVDELLSILPFKMTNLADFKKVRLIPPGAAVALSDTDSNEVDLGGPPYVIVSLAPFAPGPNDDRDRIARDLVGTLPGIKNVRITSAEPMRIGGLPGYEIRLEATTTKDDKDISLVQWLRFGTNASLRIIGGAPRSEWAQAFTRFRAVRDGVDPQN